jgi:hypothetical protein
MMILADASSSDAPHGPGFLGSVAPLEADLENSRFAAAAE